MTNRPTGGRRSGPPGVARRTPAGARPRWRRRFAVALVAVLAVAVALGWVLLGSPWLRVTKVTLTGVPAGAQHDLFVQAAGIPLGEPLVKVDVVGAEARVLALGTVAEVHVNRSLPGTVAIVVQPREPVVAVSQTGGKLVVVDKEGVAFATVTQAPGGVPVARVGDGDASLLATAAAVASAFPAGQRASIRGLEVGTNGRATFSLGSVKVVWGTSAESAFKAAVVTELIARGSVSEINVSSPRTPATK